MIIKHYFFTPEYTVSFDFESAVVWGKADALDLISDYRLEGRHIAYTRNNAFEQWEIEELE